MGEELSLPERVDGFREQMYSTQVQLKERAQTLARLPDEELRRLGEQGRELKDKEEAAEVAGIRKKYGVV